MSKVAVPNREEAKSQAKQPQRQANEQGAIQARLSPFVGASGPRAAVTQLPMLQLRRQDGKSSIAQSKAPG